jgi:hypothetical protein
MFAVAVFTMAGSRVVQHVGLLADDLREKTARLAEVGAEMRERLSSVR